MEGEREVEGVNKRTHIQGMFKQKCLICLYLL